MRLRVSFLIVLFSLSAMLAFAGFNANPALEPLRMLVGTWSAEVHGGRVEFHYEAGGQVMLGRAKPDALEQGWMELMMIYTDDTDKQVHADSYDSNQKVIHYRLATADGSTVQFVSPKYRLTYQKKDANRMTYRFERERAAHPGEFETTASGTLIKNTVVRPLSE